MFKNADVVEKVEDAASGAGPRPGPRVQAQKATLE